MDGHEWQALLQEKNRIVDELKFLLQQKENTIQDLKAQLSQSQIAQQQAFQQQQQQMQQIQQQQVQFQGQPQGQFPSQGQGINNPNAQGQVGFTISPQIEELRSGAQPVTNQQIGLRSPDPFSQSSEYFRFVRETEQLEDIKDQIIKDLLRIVVDQLDWRKAKPLHPIVKDLLTPRTGDYKFEDGLYQGELVLNVPNGEGRTTLDNGDSYFGSYLHGKKNGQGTYKWSNGDVYEGEHQEGTEHGKGMLKYCDGDIYLGDFRHGKRHGFGVLRLKNGTAEYGHFRHGHYDGKCIMIAPDEKSVSIGDLKDNKQDGAWKFYSYKEQHVYVNGSKIA